jgi:hypothetical protein
MRRRKYERTRAKFISSKAESNQFYCDKIVNRGGVGRVLGTIESETIDILSLQIAIRQYKKTFVIKLIRRTKIFLLWSLLCDGREEGETT